MIKFKVKDNTGELRPCSWEEAVVTVAKVMDSTPGDKIGALVGGMADAEVQFEYRVTMVVRGYVSLTMFLCF